MQNKITFKISVSHTGEHHLLGISFSGAKNGRIKSLRKCGERTINQISKSNLFRLDDPSIQFNGRDNIFMLKDEYKKGQKKFEVYYADESSLKS